MLAKQVATLGVMSGGRFILGVGAGWNAQEMRHHGTDPERRFGVFREWVEAMKALWADDVAQFHGRYVDFGPSWLWRKPRNLLPSIVVGGWAKAYCGGSWPTAMGGPHRQNLAKPSPCRPDRRVPRTCRLSGPTTSRSSHVGHPTDPDADLPTNSDTLADIEGVSQVRGRGRLGMLRKRTLRVSITNSVGGGANYSSTSSSRCLRSVRCSGERA